MAVIEFTSCCSATRLTEFGYSHPTFYLTYIGYQFFVVSDAILLYAMATELNKRTDLQVMSTYIVAQLLIAIGVALQPNEN